MSGYVFHPEADSDLDDIWEFIARDNLNAAGEKPMLVLAVLHGHRNPRIMSAILSGRR